MPHTGLTNQTHIKGTPQVPIRDTGPVRIQDLPVVGEPPITPPIFGVLFLAFKVSLTFEISSSVSEEELLGVDLSFITQKGRKLQLLEIRRLGSDIPEWDICGR